MKTRRLIGLGLLGILSGFQFQGSSFGETRPNVVFIFADDLGYGDLGCYGATRVQTPNIDKLAREGRRFTDAHSASAVCTPSRYALLTGDYPLRLGNHGIWGPLGYQSGLLIGTERQTLGKVFQAAGYSTACIGKWHLGFGQGVNDWLPPLKPGPLEVGFDYYFGVPQVNSGVPFVYVENHHIVGWDPNDPLRVDKKNASPTPTFPPEAGRKSPNIFSGAMTAHEIYDDERTASLLVEKATAWIGKNVQQPFFLYLPTTNIHHPFTPAPRFKGTSQCGLYGDFIHELDWMVGEVVECLEEHGVADNTLIIFTSDNGGMFNTTGQDAWDAGHRINGKLLGFKFGVWEGGHRIPFIARWPGKIEKGSVSKQLICNVDMVATMAALVGAEIKDGQARDSMNLLPALTENPEKPIREHLVLAPNKPTCLAVRKGKWMYIGGQGSGGFTGSKPGDHAFGGPPAITHAGYQNSDIENGKIHTDAPSAQLYDLEADLSQTMNLYLEYPEMVEELSALVKSYAPPPAPRKQRKPKRKGKQ
jgi:arylsulfatase A-like enzyme